MATYASRPAWTPAGARADRRAGRRPGAGSARWSRSRCCCARRELGIGFWIDEGLSVGIADRPLGDIPLALRKDGSPPLYYMLLHFWLDIAGAQRGGRARRSACCSRCWRSRSRGGRARRSGARCKAGWFAAVLMAFNPFLAQYAQEARMYSMVALLAIPATACFLRAYALDTEQRAGRGSPGFAVSVAVALYTHNWPIFFARRPPASRGRCCGSLARRAARRELLRDGLLGFGGAVVLYLPWVPTTLYQAAHTGAPWADAPAARLAARRPRRAARPDAADRAADLRRRRPDRAAARPRPLSERGRAALCLLIIARR